MKHMKASEADASLQNGWRGGGRCSKRRRNPDKTDQIYCIIIWLNSNHSLKYIYIHIFILYNSILAGRMAFIGLSDSNTLMIEDLFL
jgi:hypothetical protein